jgi:acyl carrier protein
MAPAARPWPTYGHRASLDTGQLVQELKQHLRAQLPGYMMPGAFVVLGRMPLTPNGKIDRKALPEPDRERQETGAPFVAPGSAIEQTVAMVWRDLLGLDRVGAHDNFFDIGANSLLMVQAHSALRQALDRPLSLVDLFRFPTVSALAAHLSADAPAAEPLTSGQDRARARIDAQSRRRQARNTGRPAPPTPR